MQIDLFRQINLVQHPDLVVLLEEGEEMKDLVSMSPEDILLRWVNYHMLCSDMEWRITNFSEDIKVNALFSNTYEKKIMFLLLCKVV